MSEIEFTDRYQATGIPYPDLETICPGQCEGMGCVPVFMSAEKTPDGRIAMNSESDPSLVRRWQEREAISPTDDGWHFVICPVCEGTGKRPDIKADPIVSWDGPLRPE